MEEPVYTVVVNGKPQGPYRLEQLKELNIRPDTFVRKPGMDDYKEAHEMQELRALFGFKFQQTAPQYYASFDQRLVADVVDHLAVFAVYLATMFVVYAVTSQNVFKIIAISMLPFIFVFRLVYGSIVEASVRQATIGKRLMGLKVTDMMGNRISIGNSFGRNFAKIISNATLFIGYIYSFFNKKQQCLHDVIAETLVVKDRLF